MIKHPKNVKLTKAQEKYYLAHKGIRCPFCKDDHLYAEELQADGDTITQDITCLKSRCRHTWTDIYKLQGIDVDNVYKNLKGS